MLKSPFFWIGSMQPLNKIWRHLFRMRSWKRLVSHLAALPRHYIIAGKLAEQKRKRSTYRYNKTPRIAGIIQFFNKKQNIPMLWRGIVAANFDEVIVLDDGSVDGSSTEWCSRLDHPNHFLLRSNDLFEIVTYDRALRYSRAEIVCLLQDDDQMPSDRDWIDRAISLFEQHPDLLILGGFRAVEVLPRDNCPVSEEMRLEVDGEQESVTGLFCHRTIQFPMAKAPSDVADFCFVMSVVRAPVFIRRREFLEMGGFDLDFAPFLCDDVDNCLRAWKAGYKVGLYNVDFQRDLGLGGMRAFNSKRMVTQVRNNWEKIYQKHGQEINGTELGSKIKQANESLASSNNDDH